MRSPAPTPLAPLVARAERQEGLLTRADLAELGVHQRRVRRMVLAGHWHEVLPGVLALGHGALSRRGQFLAAALWVGGDAALSHDSAAAFYGWLPEDPKDWPTIHVSTTGHRVKSRPGVVVHRTRHLDHRDVVVHGALRVTDRVRTLIDYADGHTYDELRAVADELPSLPRARLITTAARLPGRAGAGRVERLVHSEDAEARYAMERRSVVYFAAHGVPEPRRNVRVHGVLVDCWFAPGLVVELDSRAHHTRRSQFEADRLRDRALERHGIRTLRLVWRDLDLGDPLAAADILLELGNS